MPTPLLKRKSTLTPRPAEALPPDIDERQRQLAHHQRSQADAAPAPPDAPTDLPESAPPILPPAPPDLSSTAPAKPARNELQSRFLAAHLNRVVTIFLMNGIRLTGRLIGHDDFIVILAGPDGKETLTYKHAISTIMPGVSRSSPPQRT